MNAADLAEDGALSESLNALQELRRPLRSYESFWTNYARVLAQKREYSEAVHALDTTKQYTASPAVYMQSGHLKQLLGDVKGAEREYRMAAILEPGRLLPEYMLMNLFVEAKDSVDAVQSAKELLARQPKFSSMQALLYRQRADSVIRIWGVTR